MHDSRKPFRFSRSMPKVRLILFMASFLTVMPVSSHAADLSCSSSLFDFGITPVGGTACHTLTLTNNDAADAITVEDIVFTFNQGGAFSWSTIAALPAVIPPGAGMDIKLSFSPDDWGFAGADIMIYSNSDNHPSLYIYLSGAGFKR